MMLGVAILLGASTVVQFATDRLSCRLKDADPERSMARFVGYPNGAKDDHFVPNTNAWFHGIDFSCASPWNSGGGALRAGTLISRRHVVFAKHFPLWKGVRIVFVDAAGAVCPCYIEATKAVSDTDIMIGLLNAEVTPNIRPARILPEDYEKHIGHGEGLSVITFNQHEQGVLGDLQPIYVSPVNSGMGAQAPKDINRVRFNRKLIGGDSGNPAFILIGDEAVLAYCLKGGGGGCAQAIHYYRAAIQKTMDELCPGYKLEAFDFGLIEKGEMK